MQKYVSIRYFAKTIAIGLLSCGGFHVIAQFPQGIPYQAIARGSSGAIILSHTISLRFTIHDSIITGTNVYQETFTPTTNSLGLFSINVGTGTAVSGIFSSINWGHNAKFMQVEMDATGGTSYTNMGTQQMMSVPYALYAGSSNGGFTHYLGELFGGGIIFYLWMSAGTEHGLIASLADLSDTTAWSNVDTVLIGLSAESLTDGQSNTTAIISQPGHVSSAAKLCRDYSSGGFSDWYLPSATELSLLYYNIYLINTILDNDGDSTTIGLYNDVYNNFRYWSSTENNATQVMSLNIQPGLTNLPYKYGYGSYRTRAIRKF